MMQVHDSLAIAGKAVSGAAGRAASAIVHDSPDVRLVVFRLNPDDSVAMHTSTSTVVLSVVSGTGVISGPVNGEIQDVTVSAGSVVTYEPTNCTACARLAVRSSYWRRSRPGQAAARLQLHECSCMSVAA